MSKYKALYQKLKGIVQQQHRLSIQGQQQMLKRLDAVLAEAFTAQPEEIASDDRTAAVAAPKDFSAAAKPEVSDSKEKDRNRGYRWIGGSIVKINERKIDTSAGEAGVDQTIKAQINQ